MMPDHGCAEQTADHEKKAITENENRVCLMERFGTVSNPEPSRKSFFIHRKMLCDKGFLDFCSAIAKRLLLHTTRN